MERVINLCREIIENPLLPVGRIKSRKANKWLLYVRGNTFYDVVCKCYAKRYNDIYSNPYLISKNELFKTIRRAYKVRLETFTVTKSNYRPERVYCYEELQKILSNKNKPSIILYSN